MLLDQVLWLDALLKLVAGMLLLVAPGPLAAALALPKPGSAFYPRLLGATFAGIALAIALPRISSFASGLGAGGAAAINLAGLLALLLATLLSRTSLPYRGRVLLWLLTLALGLLGLAEILLAV
ncbi:MAG: hypothetical protein R3D33_05095 [Hyphomicrobiaceae bacterium]